jgi:hypothetical protein
MVQQLRVKQKQVRRKFFMCLCFVMFDEKKNEDTKV